MGHQQQQGKSVDLVHLAANISSYEGWGGNEWRAFKSLCLDKNSSYQETQEAVFHCIHSNLNPLRREIYFIRRKGKLTPQVSITGFHKMAHHTGKYKGMTPVYWCGTDKQWCDVWNPRDGEPMAAKVGVYHDDFIEPFWAVATYSEYVPGSGQDHMWKKMPAHMIAKCAKAIALREVFPDLSGYYTDDEMGQAGPPDPVVVVSQEPAKKQNNPPVKIEDTKAIEAKSTAIRELFSVAASKLPKYDEEQLDYLIRKFAFDRNLLAECEAKGCTVSGSSIGQIKNTTKELRKWEPPVKKEDPPAPPVANEEDVQEAEYDVRPSDLEMSEEIENLEAHLSQIPSIEERDGWISDTIKEAIKAHIRAKTGVDVETVYGPLTKHGLPDGNKWTEEQLFNWLKYLRNQVAEQATL